MHHCKVALIGHSGAGKSVCLDALSIDRSRADMDAVLGTNRCPSLTEAVHWLLNGSSDQPIVVVSNHEEMLKAMRRAKLAGEETKLFERVAFVYLRKPKARLARHLAKPNAAGRCRDTPSQKYTLACYDRFDAIFLTLACRTIDCTTMQVAEVAEVVAELATQLIKGVAEPVAPPDRRGM